MAAPKRPNYFNSQFLVTRDFEDEQKFHAESLRQHNLSMHDWGVVQGGLEVKKTGSGASASFEIQTGSAIDSSGHEIILDKKQTLTAAEVQAAGGAGQDVFITIAFREIDSTDDADKYPPLGGTENVTRKVQSPLIAVTKTPASDGSVIILARINGENLTNAVRKIASSFIARGSNLGDISLDGALSFTSKSSPHPTYPQVGLDFDKDQLRVRARSENASSLDLIHLTINRGNGFVGIGTESPVQKLEVAGALKLSTNQDPNNDQSGAYFWNQKDVGPTIAGGHFEVRTGGNSASLRISNQGNVGVGTTTPESKFHVLGGGNSLPNTQGSSQAGGRIVRLKNSGIGVLDIGGAGEKGFWFQSTLASDLSKHYPLLLNPTGGNVGIGTPEPGAALEVFGALKLGSTPHVTPDQTAAYFWNQGNVGPTIGGWGFEVRTGSDTARFKINNAGNAGMFGNLRIGNSAGSDAMNPATRLHVVGDGSALPANSGTSQSTGHVARLRGTTTAPTASPVLDIGSGGEKGFWLQSADPADLTKNYPLLLNPNNGNVRIGPSSQSEAVFDVGDMSIDKMKSILARLNEGNTYLGVKTYKSQPQYSRSFAIEHHFYDKLNSAINFCRGEGATGGFLTFAVNDGTMQMMLNQYGMEVTGDLNVKGRIACGGLITIRSPHWKKNISARENSQVTMVTDNDYMEHFTLEMACSREFKEDISDLTALEALTTLQNLTPVKYDYKGDKAFRQNLGFIAEDMPDNLASEDRKSISPFEVVPILTRVAKEQQRVIAELQETVRTLQSNATKKHKKHQTEGTKTYGRATTEATRAIEEGF